MNTPIGDAGDTETSPPAVKAAAPGRYVYMSYPTVKTVIMRAFELKAQADQWGYAHGFTSQKYFDALKHYLDYLEHMEIMYISPHSSPTSTKRGEE